MRSKEKDRWILSAIAAGKYLVTFDGDVFGFNNGNKPRRLKIQTHRKTGYRYFTMSYLNHQKCVLLHRVVALVYSPNPEGLLEVNHDDGNKENCSAPNLEWSTKSANEKHAYRTGLKSKTGERNSVAVLTAEQVAEIRASKATSTRLAKIYGVHPVTIRDARRGRTWRHL